jgi:hypothetical protein
VANSIAFDGPHRCKMDENTPHSIGQVPSCGVTPDRLVGLQTVVSGGSFLSV